ncbi:TIGR01244 family sulfur transferase [Falsirhodobacter deserti]|uniref:TIGR01244 family sulfur transferase n=1 Tax=Falsirhodobacter deserti TaxID=1365611 RepID=UPI000FE3A334|nr:TIGR01244 family sulfur transferase [Falsirhodobacter deserti]
MDIRQITDNYAVSPQIGLEDVATLREAGFTTVIDNRPDEEIPASLHADKMRSAVEAAGMVFVDNPITPGNLTMNAVEAQRQAIDASQGPVLAYCASGNRSSIIWALAYAAEMDTDDLIALPARHGYDLNHLRPTLEKMR